MSDRALQRQHRREAMHVGGKALDRLCRLEAEMIVAMRDLRRAAGIDDIELRSDLIGRAKPGLAHERDDRVAIIGGERPRGRAGRASRARSRCGHWRLAWRNDRRRRHCSALFVDDRPEMRVGLVDRGKVGERAADDDDAGPVGQRLDPFGHQFLARFGRSGGACAPRGRRRPAHSTRRRAANG